MKYRMRFILLMLVVVVAPVQGQEDDATPTGKVPAEEPTQAQVHSVNLGEGHFTADAFEDTWVPVGQATYRQHPSREDVTQEIVTEKRSRVAVKKQLSLKDYRVFDTNGSELTRSELRERLRPGVHVLWSENARQSANQQADVLKKGDLILVANQQKKARDEDKMVRERVIGELYICRPPEMPDPLPVPLPGPLIDPRKR